MTVTTVSWEAPAAATSARSHADTGSMGHSTGDLVAGSPCPNHNGPMLRRAAAVAAGLGLLAWAGSRGWPPLRGSPRNLLLVSIDSLRPDHLGCYGYAGAATPALDALAA